MAGTLATLALLGPLACSGGDWTQVYDQTYRVAALTQWSGERAPYWCWLKAQGAAESDLRDSVVSNAGAQGIAQFMPGTWAETMQRNGWKGSPYDPHLAIVAQASYMERLSTVWRTPRPESARLELAAASYNAGAGNIVAAQRACRGAREWEGISPCLEKVTGHHSEETIGYVARIKRFWRRLTGQEWAE